jgi:phosphatidate cytidylyltransferase
VSDAASAGMSELNKRVLSAIVMGLAAIGTTIWGGWPFQLVWMLAAVGVAYEWQRIVHGNQATTFAFLASIATVLIMFGAIWLSVWMVVAGAVVAAGTTGIAPKERRSDIATGLLYAAGLGASVILCRNTGYDGAIVIFWLFAVVWGTDTLAYFTGRSLGGPKLWPRVSPKKTWSGAIGGLIGGVILGCILLTLMGVSLRWQHIMLSIAFSVLTQAGDLFESALKRRYDVKDSSNLIPGHGGFMDRLDGFIIAVIAAAALGSVRAGWANVPKGLLVWS